MNIRNYKSIPKKLRDKIIYSPFYNPFVSLHPSPVIVLGNQKSGTTAIAALLAKATGTTSTLDIPPMWEPTFTALIQHEKPLADLTNAHKIYFSRKIIKEPCLTFLYPQIKAIFPDSKIIFIIREPCANIRSILNRLNLPGNLSDFKDHTKLPKNWEAFLTNNFSQHPIEQLNYIQIMAYRWKKALQVYEQNITDFQLIKYEDFNADKINKIHQLAQKMGLEITNDIRPFIDIQYQPKGVAPKSYEEFFGEKNLNIIRQICQNDIYP